MYRREVQITARVRASVAIISFAMKNIRSVTQHATTVDATCRVVTRVGVRRSAQGGASLQSLYVDAATIDEWLRHARVSRRTARPSWRSVWPSKAGLRATLGPLGI